MKKFSPFGRVMSTKIIMDRTTGTSKGYGFVQMETVPMAHAAINSLHNFIMEGRTLVVRTPRPAASLKPPASPFPMSAALSGRHEGWLYAAWDLQCSPCDIANS